MKPTPPIYSVFDDDPEQRERIEEFVIGLAERIDALQDAESQADLAAVRALAQRLTEDADLAGYPPLRELCQGVVTACDGDKPEDVQKGLVELTELAQRVRRGSRGAA